MEKSLFVALLLTISLTACDSGKQASAPEAAPAPATTAEAAPATTAPLSAEDAEKEKIRKQNEAAEAALSGH